MTDNLFPSLDDYMRARSSDSQRSYEVKILKKLYAAGVANATFEEDQREAGEDFGLDWFNDMSYLSISLFAKKDVVVNPAHILSTDGFTKTALYAEFSAIKNAVPAGNPIAMFFPIVHMSQFVIHNAAFLEVVPGYNVMIRNGKLADAMLRVEPMKSFLQILTSRAAK